MQTKPKTKQRLARKASKKNCGNARSNSGFQKQRRFYRNLWQGSGIKKAECDADSLREIMRHYKINF